MIEIYTDGACSGNPGPGGYGVVAIKNNTILNHYSDKQEKTTNNQMELAAMLKAFEWAAVANEECIIYSDSAYVVNIVNSWIFSWKANGWLRSKGQPIENLTIIKELYNYLITDFFKSKVQVVKVKGHCGNVGNELADALATGEMNKYKKIVKENNLGISLEKGRQRI